MDTPRRYKLLSIFYASYAVSVIVMNLLATKQVDLGPFTVTTGIIVSPIAFIIQDVITEIYGYNQASRMIWTGFILIFVSTILYQVAIIIPPSSFWEGQGAFEAILSTTPRISIASLTAYLLGSHVNTYIMNQLGKRNPDQLFNRVITSTIFGQLLDNFIFAFIAFTGLLPFPALLSMGIGGTIIEVVYEIIFYPITLWAIKKTKFYLKEDPYAV